MLVKQLIDCLHCADGGVLGFAVRAPDGFRVPERRVPVRVPARVLLPLVARRPLPGPGDRTGDVRGISVWL